MNLRRLGPTRALIRTLIITAGLVHSGHAAAEPISVDTTPLPLDTEAPDRRSVGSLVYRGGLVLSSGERTFGGLSALGVSADGNRMVALTDKGRRFAARLVYGADGDLTGLTQTALDTLAGVDGAPLAAKSESDIESMSPGVEGEIIVAFERRHRLWRYLPGVVRPEPIRHPTEVTKLPANSGIEGLALLNDGSLFAVAEGSTNLPATLAWISGRENWSTMTYALEGGFRPTGAATLASGDVLVLERRFTLRTGVAGRIRQLSASSIKPGADLQPKTVAEFRAPLAVDNFEGIAVRRTSDGRTLIYIVSDDNFNPLQRTLLMMFELRK